MLTTLPILPSDGARMSHMETESTTHLLEATPQTDGDVDSTTSIAAIRESLARSKADVTAGRTTAGHAVLAKLRSMIERHEAQQRDGAPRR